MTTVLGIVAGSTQLAEQCLAITKKLYTTLAAMKEAPELIKLRLDQVQQMTSVSQLIIQNASFQIAQIESILRSCLHSLTKLEKMLLRLSTPKGAGMLKRGFVAFLAVMKEREVEKAFSGLDRDTMTLITCMATIGPSQLQAIGIQVQAVRSTTGDMATILKDSARNLQVVRNILPTLSDDVTTMRTQLPEMSDKLAPIPGISDKLDMLSQKLTVVNDMLPAIVVAMDDTTTTTGKPLEYFNMPHRRSRQFVGRQDIIIQLRQALVDGYNLSPRRCAVLRSLGGQGKTQAALEFCQQTQRRPYSTIFWVDASSEMTIRRDFALFYERSRQPDEAVLTSPEGIVTYICDRFTADTLQWLFVFDNLDDPAVFPSICTYIPQSQKGSILITTRIPEAKQLAAPGFAIELGPLPVEDAIQLLLLSARTENAQQDEVAAEEIVKLLNCHALAITQAGAYIRKKRLLLASFGEHYNLHLKNVLSQTLSLADYTKRLPASEKETVQSLFASWELSLQQLKDDELSKKKHKEDLLNLLAFSYGLEVTENPFMTFCTNMNPWDSVDAMDKSPGSFLAISLGRWDTWQYCDTLAELYQLALIEDYHLTEDGFYVATVHPLVKDWMRVRLDGETAVQYQLLIVDIATESINPSKDETQGLRSSSLEQNAGNVLQNLNAKDKPSISTDIDNATRLLLELVLEVRRNPVSESLNQIVILLAWELSENARRELTQEELNNAAMLLRQHRYVETESIIRCFLPRAIIYHGSNGERCCFVLQLLGTCLLNMYDGRSITEARQIFQALYSEGLAQCGAEDPNTVGMMHNLGMSLNELGHYDEAAKLQEKELEILIRLHGAQHPKTLECMLILSKSLYAQDTPRSYEEAKRLTGQVLQRYQQVHGPKNFKTLDAMRLFGQIVTKENPKDAIHIFRTAIVESTSASEEHPWFIFGALNDLGNALRRNKFLKEAERELKNSLALNPRASTINDLSYLETVKILSWVKRDQGQYEEAETYMVDAINGLTKHLGANHSSVLQCVNSLRTIVEAKASASNQVRRKIILRTATVIDA